MSENSDEEIIKRRRLRNSTTKKRDLRDLFEDKQSSESYEYEHAEIETGNIFFEIFGTGREYFYIFDKTQENQKIIKNTFLDSNDVIEYVKNVLPDYENVCRKYLEGYNMCYTFFNETENVIWYDFVEIWMKIYRFHKRITSEINFNFKTFFNIFFDRFYNGCLNIKDDDVIFSITKNNKLIKGVILDRFGNLLDKFSLSEIKIEEKVKEINPKYIVVSGHNNLVRNVIQALVQFKVFYMESKFFNNMTIFDQLVHVGRLSIYPEIEFINLYRNLHVSQISTKIDYSNLHFKDDKNNEELAEIIKIAIQVVISITKIDIEFLLKYENKLQLLQFLGLENCTRIFENIKYDNIDEIKNIITDDVIFRNFSTYFVLKKDLQRPCFNGFTDNFIFKELVTIESNTIEDLINKEVEGKIFYVDDYYILVNILNNITCYVKVNEKYFLNQLVKIKILEINEPFLSFTGEIVTIVKKSFRNIKHPLYVTLNSKEAEKKLLNSTDYFLLRQSNKDGSLIIVMKLYENIITHFKLLEWNNIDEDVNKKVKNILRNVNNIQKHMYFYKDENKALEEMKYKSNYIKYGFYFSEEYPGKLVFIYNNGGIFKKYLSVEEKIRFQNDYYENLEDFVKYIKNV